jgi:hypothetical protein
MPASLPSSRTASSAPDCRTGATAWAAPLLMTPVIQAKNRRTRGWSAGPSSIALRASSRRRAASSA